MTSTMIEIYDFASSKYDCHYPTEHKIKWNCPRKHFEKYNAGRRKFKDQRKRESRFPTCLYDSMYLFLMIKLKVEKNKNKALLLLLYFTPSATPLNLILFVLFIQILPIF